MHEMDDVVDPEHEHSWPARIVQPGVVGLSCPCAGYLLAERETTRLAPPRRSLPLSMSCLVPPDHRGPVWGLPVHPALPCAALWRLPLAHHLL